MKDEFWRDMQINFLSGKSTKATELFNFESADLFDQACTLPLFQQLC